MSVNAAPVSVLIVCQQRTFGDAIAEWLGGKPEVTVVAAVASAEAARRLLVGRRIDVIVIDGELPDGAALSLCADMSGSATSSRVVVLSASADPERIAAALRAGAVAWVCKDEPMEHLFRVVCGTASGEAWIPPVLLHRVIRVLLDDEVNTEADPLAALTHREREVLALIAHGYGRKEVAEQLHVSVNTVRTHMQSLLAKLGVHSAVEAVALIGTHLGEPAALRDNISKHEDLPVPLVPGPVARSATPASPPCTPEPTAAAAPPPRAPRHHGEQHGHYRDQGEADTCDGA
jgi:DNA-binding NarL/FixJ family response regulator